MLFKRIKIWDIWADTDAFISFCETLDNYVELNKENFGNFLPELECRDSKPELIHVCCTQRSDGWTMFVIIGTQFDLGLVFLDCKSIQCLQMKAMINI